MTLRAKRQPLSRQLFRGPEYHVGCLVERIQSDDHDFHKGRGGKGTQLAQTAAVVLDQVNRLVAIEGAKVIACDLDILDHTLIDGDTGHDDDELAEPIVPSQLIDRAQIGIGLAGAGLHLNCKIGIAPRFVPGTL